MLTFSLVLCGAAHAGDAAQFTLLPMGGKVPFEATCFNDVATAQILTWKQFTEIEFDRRLEFELTKTREMYDLRIGQLEITLEETQIRFGSQLDQKDAELTELRSIIKKDRKKNIPAIIAGSVAAGVFIGFGSAYAINQALN
jgi:hypothetical protein